LEKLVKAKPDYSELVKALDKEPVDNLEKYARYDEIQTRFNEKQLKELKDAIKSISVGSGGIKTVKLEAGDIQIGAVEIKDGDTDQRATVNTDGQLHTVLRGKEDTGNSTITPLVALYNNTIGCRCYFCWNKY